MVSVLFRSRALAASGAAALLGASTFAVSSTLHLDNDAVLQKKPIYSQPAPPVTLVETHTALEGHVGDARRAVVSTVYGVKDTVQGQVSRWIGVERAVERKVVSLVPRDENLTPGAFYVGVATLSALVFTRYRAFPIRLIAPPAFFFGSLNYFLPKTASNLSSYYRELESSYAPSVKQQREELLGQARSALSKAEGTAEEAKQEAEGAWSKGLSKVEQSTGLKLAGKGPAEAAKDAVDQAKKSI